VLRSQVRGSCPPGADHPAMRLHFEETGGDTQDPIGCWLARVAAILSRSATEKSVVSGRSMRYVGSS